MSYLFIGCHIYLTFLHSPPLVKRSNLWFLNWYNQALTGNAKTILTLPVPIPDEEKKKNYFHTFLWCLKRLYEGRKGFKRSRREFFIKMSWKTWATARMLFTSRSLLLEEFYVRSSQLELFWQKGVLKNFVKFTGRRRCQGQKKNNTLVFGNAFDEKNLPREAAIFLIDFPEVFSFLL